MSKRLRRASFRTMTWLLLTVRTPGPFSASQGTTPLLKVLQLYLILIELYFPETAILRLLLQKYSKGKFML